MTDDLRRAVFLDRDGVINQMVYDPEHGTIDSPSRPDQLKLMPGIAQAIRSIKHMGFLVVVVSNQPGVALGKYTMDLLLATDRKMRDELTACQAAVDQVYYCLHHPEAVLEEYRQDCPCRKPKPGLLVTAAVEMRIEPVTSYMIGDGLVDIEAGQAAGCRTILIAKTKCYQCIECFKQAVTPDRQVESISKAVDYIRAREGFGVW